MFNTIGYLRLVKWCDVLQGDLHLREGEMSGANTLFHEGLRATWGKNSDIVAYCLERLGDISRWDVSCDTSAWTIVFLAFSHKSKQKLYIYKALQFLADIFLTWGDEDTALSLFTVALKEFTYMDVHRSRAECMLRLGDIHKGRSDLLKALELWKMAKPLFERSSQTKQVEYIDEKLASNSKDVLDEHRNNLTLPAESKPLSGTME
jgi:tetratricopeptide (TPR) repeat protein